MKSPRHLSLFLVSFMIFFSISFSAQAEKHPPEKGSYLVYVGTYTGPTSKGIYTFRFDPRTGRATSPQVAAETVNPSFLAVHPNGRFLFAVNEVSDYQGQKSGAVSAFSIDHTTGKLTVLNQVSSRGAGPCYITLDKSGKYVMVANYDSGTVAVFPIGEDGKLGEASSVVQHSGHGPDAERQEGPHAHEIEVSPNNRFALAADLGLDKLLVYKFDPAKGTLERNDPAFAEVDPASGPRHFAFTPDGKFVYVIEEMKSAVAGFAFDSNSATLHKIETLPSLPKEFTGHNDGAELAVHPSGKFVYASNRGHDSIAVFAIGAQGKLTPLEYVPTQGKTPRGFAMDPKGRYLFAANQESNTIVIFRIDPKSGRLKPTGQVVDVPTPVALQFTR